MEPLMSLRNRGRSMAFAAVVSVFASIVGLHPSQATTLDVLCAAQDDPCIVDQAIALWAGSGLDQGDPARDSHPG